ncbi:MAG: hypothetical protein A3G87_08135 [Omnitrophica bacterium RIFCSPLOWO2_12_FULL_50_11]|nr:MAG: hypothetical protein A3G87_08135 [Omnitrophica bacterium RIFCSPLOWO2_12_FULL_50_11]
MADEMPAIKKVAHFFLSAHPKDSVQPALSRSLASRKCGVHVSPAEDKALILQALAERGVMGLIWFNLGKSHLVFTAAFAQRLVKNASGERRIRIIGFKRSLESWLELRSYFPSLPYSPPSEEPSGYTLFSLSPEVELAYVFGEGGLRKMGKPEGSVNHLLSLSGREEFLGASFFHTLDEIVLITPPDRSSLTELYRALKWLAEKVPWLSAGMLLDGAGFSYSEAWSLFEEYGRVIIPRFLARSPAFYGLCDSEQILKRAQFSEPAVTDISFF